MTTTYSSNLRINLIGTGDQAGVWGNTTNTNLGNLLEEAIAGYTTKTISLNPDFLAVVDGADATFRYAAIKLTGGSANFVLYVPPYTKTYILNNATSYTATVAVSTLPNGTTSAGGSTITIPAGKTVFIYSDSTNLFNVLNYISGSITVSGSGTFGGDGSFSGTGSLVIPVGTTAQQAGGQGGIRYNTTLNRFEGNNGSAWGGLGGGATGGGADQVFVQNQPTVTTNYTLTTGFNAMSVGPITIDNGITVTVPAGQRWVVL